MKRRIFEKVIKVALEDLGFYVETFSRFMLAKNDDVEVEIHYETIFEAFKNWQDEKALSDLIVKKIQSQIKSNRKDINLEEVYPIIKSRDFGLDLDTNLLRDSFTPELDIMYVEQRDGNLYFLNENELSDNIRKKSMENLSSHFIEPIIDNKHLNLLRYPFPSFLNSAMVLHEKTRKLILEKLGENVLFILPSEAVVVFCKDDEIGRLYLESFMQLLKEDDDDLITISDKTFRWNLINNSITDLNLKINLRVLTH